MPRVDVTIEVDTDRLATYDDRHLALLWHVAQANPAPIADREAGEIAEAVGREIIRRWLKDAPVELWHHTSSHHFWDTLVKHGKWKAVNGDENNRQWTPDAPEAHHA